MRDLEKGSRLGVVL